MKSLIQQQRNENIAYRKMYQPEHAGQASCRQQRHTLTTCRQNKRVDLTAVIPVQTTE